MKKTSIAFMAALLFNAVPSWAQDVNGVQVVDPVAEQISYLQNEWSRIKYQIPDDEDKLVAIHRLETHAASAPGLWLEVDEQGALSQLALLRELVGMAHARSARVGLEHAGHHLSDPSALLEAGLDFVKLDASVTEGIAHDEALGQHADALVRMLHGIGLKVYAEGVASADDAAALWQAGVDGITGPAARR